MVPENVSLYLGAPIDQESEREVLRRLLTMLEEVNEPATVLANFHVGGRQLDLVIGLPALSLVLEVKGTSLPLSGTSNGEWSVTTRCGSSRPARNAYRQALDAKNALADEMRRLGGRLKDYPNACVVFTPSAPPGSSLPPSDHKVALGSVTELDTQLRGTSSLRLDETQWRHLAEVLGLRQVNSFEAAFDPQLIDAQHIVERYREAFVATYGPLARRHVPDTYRLGSEYVDVARLHDSLKTLKHDLLIRGPSGCGKSLLSYALAHRLATSGVVPLVIDGKSFDGRLGPSLEQEATVLDVPSASRLLRAARLLSLPIAFVADGYNECAAPMRSRLTRTLRAASVRYDAIVVVSSSLDVERGDLLNLHHVEVTAPSASLKARIAGVDVTVDAQLAPLLETVTTGFEAALVGQVGRELSPASSRFAILDYFVRRKFGDDAREAVQLLCAVAGWLTERVAFTLSVRDLDRLMSEKQQLRSALAIVQRHGILSVRSDRVSFDHEMYLNAFSAEAILRKLSGNVRGLAETLSSPRFAAMRVPLIGAIDDESLVLELLSATADTDLLKACLRGECGSTAKQFMLSQLDDISDRLRAEAELLRFEVTADGVWNVEIAAGCQAVLTSHDTAMLSIFALELAQGRRVLEYLRVMTKLDQTLDDEFRRLRPIAREKKVAIRTGMFAVVHMFPHNRTGVTQPGLMLHSGGFTFEPNLDTIPFQLLKDTWPLASSNSEFYLLLALTHRRDTERADFLPYVLPLLELERWKALPYHLQLDLLRFVHFSPDVADEMRAPLVEVLEKLLPNLHPFLTQDVFEILSRFGALGEEEREQFDSLQHEVERVLDEPLSAVNQAHAWSIYNAQFDHPFSGNYCQILEGLNEDQRLTLFQMASLGAENAYSFFLSTLIDQLGQSGDVRMAAAVTRWTALPSRTAAMPQNEVETYICAYVALGKLGVDLPSEATRLDRGDFEDALTACGLLYFWLERHGSKSALSNPDASAAMKVLLKPGSNVAAGMLYELMHSLHGRDGRGRALIDAFPCEALTICRRALARRGEQVGYFAHSAFYDSAAICNLAIAVVERFGTRLDLVLLRTLVNDSGLTQAALTAIKAIEQRAEIN